MVYITQFRHTLKANDSSFLVICYTKKSVIFLVQNSTYIYYYMCHWMCICDRLCQNVLFVLYQYQNIVYVTKMIHHMKDDDSSFLVICCIHPSNMFLVQKDTYFYGCVCHCECFCALVCPTILFV